MDRFEIIEAAARNVGDLHAAGTSSAATGTTVDAPFLVEPLTGQLAGYYAYFRTGPAQSRITTDSVPSANRIVVGQALSPMPTQHYFAIFRRNPKESYENALVQAIRKAQQHYLQDYTATMKLVASQYEYAVPSGLEWINSLQLVPSGSSSDYSGDDEVDTVFNLDHLWDIKQNPQGSQVIIFDPRNVDMDTLDDEWVRIQGQKRLSIAPSDNATVPADVENFLTFYTSAMVCIARMSDSQNDPWRVKFQIYQGLADDAEDFIHVAARGVKVPNANPGSVTLGNQGNY